MLETQVRDDSSIVKYLHNTWTHVLIDCAILAQHMYCLRIHSTEKVQHIARRIRCNTLLNIGTQVLTSVVRSPPTRFFKEHEKVIIVHVRKRTLKEH